MSMKRGTKCKKSKTVTLRFMEKIAPEPNTGCWLWLNCVDRKGYGKFGIDRKAQLAHRVSYVLFRGPIPEGLVIDHLCNTPTCVNPSHLRATTAKENTMRGNSFSAQEARRTHCPHGHPYSGENLRYRPNRSGRVCRECERRKPRRGMATWTPERKAAKRLYKRQYYKMEKLRKAAGA